MQLPRRRQIQIIADLLADPAHAPQIDPQVLSEPWRDYYHWGLAWIADADGLGSNLGDPQQVQYDFMQAYAGLSNEHLANQRLISEAITKPVTYPAADRQLGDVAGLSWLWEGWLLRGMPSLLAGVPGTGKSYLLYPPDERRGRHAVYQLRFNGS
jgi:hypothetical protein